MKEILLTKIAAVLLVGCGEPQQSAPAPEAKTVEPVAEVPSQPSPPPVEAKPAEPVAEAAQPEPPTAKAPDISILDAIDEGNIEAVKQHLAAGADLNARIHFSPKGLDLRTVKYEWLPESRMPPRPDASELGGITINVVGWRF